MSIDLARRQFFTSSASGLGTLALTSLLQQEGLLASYTSSDRSADPLRPNDSAGLHARGEGAVSPAPQVSGGAAAMEKKNKKHLDTQSAVD